MNRKELVYSPLDGRSVALDFWRGIAIILVVIVHSSLALDMKGGLAELSQYGQYGVQLFFLLSGFLMASIYGDAFRNGIDVRLFAEFMVKRVFRVAPMFYIGGFIYFLYFGFSARHSAPEGVGWVEVMLTVGFMHWLMPSAYNSIVPGGWSIACEMMFYLTFPLLNGLFCKCARFPEVAVFMALGISFLAVLLTSSIVPYSEIADKHPVLWREWVIHLYPTQLVSFSVGMYMACNAAKSGYRALLVAISLLLCHQALHINQLCMFHYYLPLASLVVLFGFFSPPDVLKNVLVSAVSRIGVVSFSIYILHFGVVGLLKRFSVEYLATSDIGLIHLIAYSGFVLCISFVMASVTYKAIELRFVRVGKAVSARFFK